MIIQELPKWFWVNNPINLVFKQETTETLDYATVKIYDGATLLAETVYIAPTDPVTSGVLMTVDISGIAKNLLLLEEFEKFVASLSYAFGHYRLCTIKVYINTAQTSIYNKDHVFVYGGIEPTDSIDIDDYLQAEGADVQMQWLTEFDEPSIFVGYPFELCFSRRGYTPSTAFDLEIRWTAWKNRGFDYLYSAIQSTTLVQDTTTFDILKLSNPPWSMPGETKYVTISENPYPDTYLSEIMCKYITPEISGGVFLRWINRLGGTDSYYFIRKDNVSKIKTTVVAVPKTLSFSNSYNKGAGKVVNKEKNKTIMLGAFMLTTNEFENIAMISDSERVDMYLDGGWWIQVIVNDASWNLSNDNDYHDIEFSITVL